MAEEQEILEEPQVDESPEQEEGPGPKPALSEDHRKKLDSIVGQMVVNKESEENIKKVIEDFKGKYAAAIPKMDFRTIPTQKPASESTAIPKSAPQKVLPGTTATQMAKAVEAAHDTLKNELSGNADLIPERIKSLKGQAAANQNLTNFAERPRTDQPLTGSQQTEQALTPPQQPTAVSPEEIQDFQQNLLTNQNMGRAFLQHVADKKTDKSKTIQEALYVAKASERAANNPEKTEKILENAYKIKKGEVGYGIQSGLLYKPEDPWQSIATGLQEKNKAFADYTLFSNANPEQAIQELEKRRSEHDADEPTPVPANFISTLTGGMAEQPLKGLIAGKIAGGITGAIPGGQAFAPAADKFITAAVSGNDFRKMSYANGLQKYYNQLRNEGLSEQEAYQKANGQAKDESMVDAVSGAAMMYAGGKIGEMKLPSFNLSEGYKTVLTTALKQGAKGIGEAGAVGLIQGAGQDAKNKLADMKGIKHDETGADIGHAMESGAMFTLGMAAFAKGFSELSGATKSKLAQYLSKAPAEEINKELGSQILEGHITPEEAQTAAKAIEEHRTLDESIPENVSDEFRMKIQDKIKRRRLLEIQMESADAAFHPEIKEKIKAVNEDILELSKDKTPKGEESEFLALNTENNEKTQAAEAGQVLGEQAVEPTENVPRGTFKENDYVLSNHFDGVRKIVHVSEDGSHVVVEDPGGEHIRHEIPVDEITLKVKSNAKTIRSDQGQIQEGGNAPEGGQNPRSDDLQQPAQETPVNGEIIQPSGEGKVEEPAMTGITHAQTDETAKQLGLDTYEQKPETVAEWDAEADKRLRENPQTISRLLKKLEEGHEPDKIDQRIMIRHLSSLKARIEENPTDELLAQYKRAKDLSDIVGGREVAKSLVARRGSVEVKDSLADYMVDEMEAAGVDELTPEQKIQNQKEHEDISKTEQAYQDKIKDLEAENLKLKANAELGKIKKSAKGVKKTHDDYVKERKSYLDELKELKAKEEQRLKDQGIHKMGVGFTFTADMAKVIGKIVKSVADEGLDKLEDVVKAVHEQIKDIFPGVEEKDIHNVIAGEYAEKRSTKNELSARMRDLKDEAALINKLDALQNGKEPVSAKKKVERNQQITTLRKQIKGLQDEKNKADKEGNKFYTEETNKDRSALNGIKTRNKTETEKIKEAIAKGEFEPEKKKTPLLEDPEIKKKFPNLLKDVLESRDAMIKAKQDREIRLLKQQYSNRSKLQKTMDVIAELGNTPRALMSSMDFSAPLRQGLFGVTKQLVSQPGDLARQFGFMFKAAKSQKIFDRWFTDLKDAPDFHVLDKSGLPLSDPLDPKLSVKEEAFMSNYAEKIPIIGRFIKGSERAYVGFLNKMRVDMFRRGADGFAANGKTFENSPELYKAFADYIGAATGRGKMPEILEKSAPILNAAFFSPRLIASRLNLLTNWANPKFYTKVPKEVRVQYFKDMAKFIGTGMLVLGIAKMGGAEVEDDPRSSDFGKIKSGNTRWDIWGGFQQYVRLAAQLLTGEKKSTTTENISELNGEGRNKTRADALFQFARGKLAPVPAEIVDLLAGKDVTGKPATLGSEAMKNLPLVLGDISEAFKDKGVQGALQVGIPSMFGVGVQTYGGGPMTGGSGGGAGAGGNFKIKEWK